MKLRNPDNDASLSQRSPRTPHPSALPNHHHEAPSILPSGSRRSSSIPRSHTAESCFKPQRQPHARSDSPDSSTYRSASTRHRRRHIRALLNYLMGFDYDSLHDDNPLDDALSIASKRRAVYNILQVPKWLERLMFFGQAICLHDLLSVFTFLPVRLLIALCHLTFNLLRLPLRLWSPRPPLSDSERSEQKRTYVTYAVDVVHVSLLLLTVAVLYAFDTSRIYHGIRGQSVIKLYVVFNLIEIFDRLCSSFGVDMLDSLGWTTASAVSFFVRPKSSPIASDDQRPADALHAFVLLLRVIFDYVLTLMYVVVHACLLLTWVVTLNVAINTQNHALLTLLVSNNFVELKGSAFKSFKVQNVFQIACSDAVERFQLSVFLVLMIIVTNGDERLYLTWAVIYGCEVVVDWIKHAFVLKFNKISFRIYRQFGLVICDDVVRPRSHAVARSIGGSALSKRIGFVALPLAALVVRMVLASLKQLPWFAVLMVWGILVCIKCALSICLVGHAWRRVRRGCAEASSEEDRARDEFWLRKLMQVERYDLIEKN